MLFSFVTSIILVNIIFFIGLFGIFLSFRSNFFIIISVETMFIAINLNFLFFSMYLNSLEGIIFIIFIMAISAVEIVIFLSYFVVFYKRVYLLDLLENFNYLKQ